VNKIGCGYVESVRKEDRGLVVTVVFPRRDEIPDLNWGDVWLQREVGIVRLESPKDEQKSESSGLPESERSRGGNLSA